MRPFVFILKIHFHQLRIKKFDFYEFLNIKILSLIDFFFVPTTKILRKMLQKKS